MRRTNKPEQENKKHIAKDIQKHNKTQNGTITGSKQTYAEKLLQKFESIGDENETRSGSYDGRTEDAQTTDTGKWVTVTGTRSNIRRKDNKSKIHLDSERHANNVKGHVTVEDIEAMKRWFVENWKECQVIPFEIFTLETFLIKHFDYTYDQIENLAPRKKKILESRYALYLSKISDIVHGQLFMYENLKRFTDMCRRNFNRNHSYNTVIQSYISEKMVMKMGYLISESVAIKMQDEGRSDYISVKSKTKLHTVLTWLKKGKFVYVPPEYREKLEMEAAYDTIDKMEDLSEYTVGYGAFRVTDVKSSDFGIDCDPRLNWFVALNSYFETSPLLTAAPMIKNFAHQPHLASVTYTTETFSQPIDCYILVDWMFYQTYKNESGLINININEDIVLINTNIIPMTQEEINKLTLDLTIGIQRMSGVKITGNLKTVSIQVRKSLSKMGSFMSKLASSKDRFLARSKDIYKLSAVAGKASGKTTLISLIKAQLSDNIFIEDSDDYGRFVTYIACKYGDGDLTKLNESMTDIELIAHAKEFAALIDQGLVNEYPSYYNYVVSNIVANEVNKVDWDKMTKVNKQIAYPKFVSRLYTENFTAIRDLYYQLDSGKVLNQKHFEMGILHYMRETNKRVLLSFFHIFACTYRRTPSDLTIRYEPNFDTDIALYSRMLNNEITMNDAVSDTILKMYYSQSAEYVTSITGPAAFMCLFGLIPVLSMDGILRFEFKTHSDIRE